MRTHYAVYIHVPIHFMYAIKFNIAYLCNLTLPTYVTAAQV